MTTMDEREYRERLKELSTINQTVKTIKEGRNVDETLQIICNLLPDGWQYPEITTSRIIFDDKIWISKEFNETTNWFLKQEFITIDRKSGSIEIYYKEPKQVIGKDPFLKEEYDLLNNLTNILTGYLNSMAGLGVFDPELLTDSMIGSGNDLHILHNYLVNINADRDLYHDLGPFKVRDILLVATLFDTISLGLEGTSSLDLFENYMNKYHSIIPRITGVTSIDEAMEQLQKKNFDLVIILPGISLPNANNICINIKARYSYLPVYLLSNNNIRYDDSDNKEYYKAFNCIYEWHGNPNIFFSMAKMPEDRINIKNDTEKGLVNVIMIADSNPHSYSSIIPAIYQSLLDKLIEFSNESGADDTERLLRLASRPKVILIRDFDEGKYLYEKYQEHVIAFISNMDLSRNGINKRGLGLKIIKDLKMNNKSLPTLLFSSDMIDQEKVLNENSIYFNTGSGSFLDSIASFIIHQIDIDKRLKFNKSGINNNNLLLEFIKFVKEMDDEKIRHHAKRNHFSMFFKNKGFFHIAKMLYPLKITDNDSVVSFKKEVVDIITVYSDIRDNGKVVEFSRDALLNPLNIVRLADGLLGGKGKGLAFLNSMLNTLGLNKQVEGIKIEIPLTSIIGSEEFENFLQINGLTVNMISKLSDENIRKRFASGRLSDRLKERLKIIIEEINKPLAIRSSASIEDAINTPFSGIFDTYMIPNNHENAEIRYSQLETAVKLVMASYFSENARKYMKAVKIDPENEKMCVIVQEVVGSQHEDYFYPHISGVAQSYNYYPVSHMKPEDGFSSLAVGLGINVVEGEKTFRFSPVNPEIDATSTEDQLRDTQTRFYAIDLSNKNPNLLAGQEASLKQLDISTAEKHGTLNHLVSVFRVDNRIITPGLRHKGPRVVNFANILKYNYLPLAPAINKMLQITQESLGCPSEIEFAVDIAKSGEISTFYLLQVVPLTGNIHDYSFDMNEIDKEKLLLKANKGMGNGEINDIDTIVYLPPYNFNKMETELMAREIGQINQLLIEKNKKYLLIGPGRWGTRDRFIGIPVIWPQIANAKVIVEYSTKDFPLDASLGSHFFHNVTSNDIGYLSVGDESESLINWKLLDSLGKKEERNHFTISYLKDPIQIKIDGKKRIAAITI
jgi:hypothetical protein